MNFTGGLVIPSLASPSSLADLYSASSSLSPGNYLTLLTPLHHSLGTFLPILDSVAYPQVNLTKNLPDPALDSTFTYGQVAWHIAGLSEGDHVFEMQNVGGEAEGNGGVMMVDDWLSGTVSQAP